MRAETLGQTLATDFRRIAWIYPSAIAVAIAFMAFQSVSGTKIFTFNSPEPVKIFQPAPEIRPEDIKAIRDEVLQSQQRIRELQDQITAAKTELAALESKSSELVALREKDAVLVARLSSREDVLASISKALDPATTTKLEETARRVGTLETLVTMLSSTYPTVTTYTPPYPSVIKFNPPYPTMVSGFQPLGAAAGLGPYYSWIPAPGFESLGVYGVVQDKNVGIPTPFAPFDGIYKTYGKTKSKQ
jgi:hypothetical protein